MQSKALVRSHSVKEIHFLFSNAIMIYLIRLSRANIGLILLKTELLRWVTVEVTITNGKLEQWQETQSTTFVHHKFILVVISHEWHVIYKLFFDSWIIWQVGSLVVPHNSPSILRPGWVQCPCRGRGSAAPYHRVTEWFWTISIVPLFQRTRWEAQG